MRRALTLLAIATVACGISVVGIDAVTGGPVDGGPESSIDVPDVITDAGVVPPPPPEADIPDVDDRDVPRTDARPPDRGDCTRLLCDGGDASGCFEESCGTANASHFPDRVVTDGGTLDDTALDCTTSTSDAGSTSYKAATLPAAGRYQFNLRFQIITAGDALKAAIAEISTGTTAQLRVLVDQGQLRVCNAQARDAQTSCTTPIPITSPMDIHLYGSMGEDQRFGAAILEVGRTECTEVATLDLDGPFQGATVTAKIGCLGDAPCFLFWDDARFTVSPY